MNSSWLSRPSRLLKQVPVSSLSAARQLPLGIILCAGKNTEQIELLELGTAGIHVAEYLTVLPPPDVLRRKLHDAIVVARLRFEQGASDEANGD